MTWIAVADFYHVWCSRAVSEAERKTPVLKLSMSALNSGRLIDGRSTSLLPSKVDPIIKAIDGVCAQAHAQWMICDDRSANQDQTEQLRQLPWLCGRHALNSSIKSENDRKSHFWRLHIAWIYIQHECVMEEFAHCVFAREVACPSSTHFPPRVISVMILSLIARVHVWHTSIVTNCVESYLHVQYLRHHSPLTTLRIYSWALECIPSDIVARFFKIMWLHVRMRPLYRIDSCMWGATQEKHCSNYTCVHVDARRHPWSVTVIRIGASLFAVTNGCHKRSWPSLPMQHINSIQAYHKRTHSDTSASRLRTVLMDTTAHKRGPSESYIHTYICRIHWKSIRVHVFVANAQIVDTCVITIASDRKRRLQAY